MGSERAVQENLAAVPLPLRYPEDRYCAATSTISASNVLTKLDLKLVGPLGIEPRTT
jgi:hypothetical protein